MNHTNQTDNAVQIRTYRLARDLFGAKAVQWEIEEGDTVADLLEAIGSEHDVDPDDFLVMVNRRNIKQLDGTSTVLDAGDDVTISIGAINE